MVFIDKMHFYYKKIDNGKVTQPEGEKNELPFRFINTHSINAFSWYHEMDLHSILCS